MTDICQNTAVDALVFGPMVTASDHVTGSTATPTVTISKNGGSPMTPNGTVSSIGSGMFAIAPNATDSNTLGTIAIHATATGADPYDDKTYRVVAYNPQAADGNGLLKVDVVDILGTLYGGTAGKFLDWAQIANPATAVTLTATNINNVQGSVGSLNGLGAASLSLTANALAGATTVTVGTSLLGADNLWNGMAITFTSSTFIESRVVTSCIKSTGIITLDRPLLSAHVLGSGAIVWALPHAAMDTDLNILADVMRWNNTNNIAVDSNGYPDVNTKDWADSSARAAAGFAGRPSVSLEAILGTQLSETTVGNLATALKKLLDVAAPVLTVASVNQTGDSYAITNNASYGNSQLLSAIQNVQSNTFIASSIPGMLALPASGSATIQIVFTFYDETGAAKNLDNGNPTAVLVNDAGTDESTRLGAWSNPATGKYVINYASASSDALEGLHWDVSGTINGKLRRIVAYTQIVDTINSTFTAADRTLLTNVSNVSPAFQPNVDSSGRVLLQPTQSGVTIPTVTTAVNLTNAPANGDFTSTMKNSLNSTTLTVSIASDSITSIASETASVLFVDGITNPLKVNADHSVDAYVDESGIAADVVAALQNGPGITVQNNITVPPAVALASQEPGVIACLRGDTLRNSLPLLGNIAARTKLVMTAKVNINDLDSQAVFQVVEGVGLVRLNGSGSVTAGTSSLTVRDSTTGAVDLELDAIVTAALAVRDLVWDVQVYFSTGIASPISGVLSVFADVTQAVT